MAEKVLVDYDEKFDVLKIVIDSEKDSHGVDFPGGVVFRSIADDSVTGVMLWNASKVIDRKSEGTAQQDVGKLVDDVRVNVGAARKQVTVYTDGSCLENPGPGGWAAIVAVDGDVIEMSGGEAQTTNNRMELLSVISALAFLKEPAEVVVYADSQYVINGIEKGWARNWRKNGWMKSNKQPALNPDLWDQLLRLCEFHHVKFRWVKGHAGNPKNEQCDRLARSEAARFAACK